MLRWGGMVAIALGAAAVGFGAPASPAAAADCAASPSAADLDAFFGADDAAGLAGADYPHAYALPDGRTLWTFQDAFFGADGLLGNDLFAHNAALVQTGDCFQALPSSGGSGTAWLGSWVETHLTHWFWPLDAEVGADGNLWLFLAEVRNPNGNGASEGAEPVATWRARFRLPGLELVDLERATDPSGALFGYSVVSDDEFSYLYGHCYRQFLPGAGAGFDPSCSPFAYLARVPRGRFDDPLEYWAGTGWTTDRSAKVPVLTGRESMPVSVERFGDVYVAVSDEDDWFGSAVVIRTASAPQGPWTEVVRYTSDTKCGDACNNYGAFVLPHLQDDQVLIAQSNNAWDMEDDSFPDASLYRIDVRAVDVPGVGVAPEPIVDVAVTSTLVRAVPPACPVVVAVDAGRTTRSLDASALVVTSPPGTPAGWSQLLLTLLRAASLALAALVAAAATTGFATTARGGSARRRRAVARMRNGGNARAHHTTVVVRPPIASGVGVAVGPTVDV